MILVNDVRTISRALIGPDNMPAAKEMSMAVTRGLGIGIALHLAIRGAADLIYRRP